MGRGHEQIYFQRRHMDGQQTHEKMLNIINHQRNANQNPMRCHFTPVRMALIKKTTNNRCWQGCGERGILVHCWGECKLGKPLWKTA